MMKKKPSAPQVARNGTRTAYRLGLVTGETVTYDDDDVTPELLLDLLKAAAPPERFKRLVTQVQAAALPQFDDELLFIQKRLEAQNFTFTSANDPADFAMLALERAMMIAETERYFQTLRKYSIAKNSRASALKKNREAASVFPPGSKDRRDLVVEFGRLSDAGKDRRNIPATLHAIFIQRDYKVGIMAVRRALKSEGLLPASRPRKQK